MRYAIGALGAVLVVALTARVARAQTCADRPQPTLADKETARTLMADARQLRESGNLQGALEKFKAADAIMKVPTTALEVARTQAAMGRLLEARDTLAEISRMPECPGDPPPFVDARANARKLDDELSPRIPSVRLNVKGGEKDAPTTVKVDDVPVPEAALSAPRKLNPGHHVIVAKSGKLEKTEEIDLAERDTKDVTLELQPPPAPPRDRTSKGGFISKPVAFVALGVGGVGLVVGTITGVMAMGAKSDAEKGCVNKFCPPSTYGDLDRASSMATVSTVSFIIGAVGVGVGVVGLLTQPKNEEPQQPPKSAAKPTVSPWIGVGSAGLSGSF
jgi:hypothetical protein